MKEEFPSGPVGGPETPRGSELPEAAFRVLGEMTPPEIEAFRRSYNENGGSDESWRIAYAVEAVQKLRNQSHKAHSRRLF